jgi:hypothetical protein
MNFTIIKSLKLSKQRLVPIYLIQTVKEVNLLFGCDKIRENLNAREAKLVPQMFGCLRVVLQHSGAANPKLTTSTNGPNQERLATCINAQPDGDRIQDPLHAIAGYDPNLATVSGLLDPDPLVRGTDPDPSIINLK